MLRHLIRSFQRVLVFPPVTVTTTAALGNTNVPPINRVLQLKLFHIGTRATTESVPTLEPISTEIDSEYIVPYRAEREGATSLNLLVEVLRTRFRLTAADVKRLMNDDIVNRAFRERSLIRTLETLCMEGVNKRSFLDYPWLITLDNSRLEQKLALIHTMPVRDINHFVPFLRLSVPRLRKLVGALNREGDIVPSGNRIYYICEKMQTDAYIVNKFLSKRLFILEMPFDMLDQNLQHMIDYKVSPMNILKDLWAFRYTPKSVQLRLERARRAKKEKIMPWMVRCPEPILQRSLKLTLDELAVLGKNTSVIEYVAERLQFSVNEAKAIMEKHPQVFRTRVTKIKEILDFLLDDAGFTRYEIAQVPRILCHGLETTKQRLEELKTHDCRPSSLVILCRSKREYDKFLKSWMNMKMKGYAPKSEDNKHQQQEDKANAAASET